MAKFKYKFDKGFNIYLHGEKSFVTGDESEITEEVNHYQIFQDANKGIQWISEKKLGDIIHFKSPYYTDQHSDEAKFNENVELSINLMVKVIQK